MNQELFGKWYVYRYKLANPVLKAPETSLKITGENGAFQARFELKGKTIEFAMAAAAGTSDWRGEDESFEVRWAQVEPCVLTGQIFKKSDPGEHRDFFVAVRSRRTKQLPAKNVYTFRQSRSAPYSEPSKPEKGISVDLGRKKIRFDGAIYQLGESPKTYGRGLRLTGWHSENDLPPQELRLWILPVDGTGRLLAAGYHEYHYENHGGTREVAGDEAERSVASRPECQRGLITLNEC